MSGVTYKEAMDTSPVILTLKINNSQPVPLRSFVKAFTTLAEEYEESLKENDDFSHQEAEIFVKEIRQGSIVADLIPIASSVVPLVVSEADKIFVAVEFVKKWEERFKSIINGVVPDNSSKGDLKRYLGTVESMARDPNGSTTLEAATFKDGKRQVEVSFTFNSNEARKIENIIEGEFQRLEEKDHADFERVLMVFTRSDVGDAPVGRRSGERVLIQEISDKPLAITYGSELSEERIKHEIRESDENIYKKGFSVDVKVQYLNQRPVAYSIMNVHQVIDLPD